MQRTPVGRAAGDDHRLQRGRGERVARWGGSRCAERVADLDARKAPELADLPGGDRRTRNSGAALENADRGDLRPAVPAEPQPVTHAQRSREHADIGDLLAGRAPLDLEDGARHRAIRISSGSGQQLCEAGHQRVHACAGDRRAKEHRMHQPPPGLHRELAPELAVGHRRLAADAGGQQRIVVGGEHVGQPGRERGVARATGRETGTARAQAACRPHRDDRRRQPLGDAPQRVLIPRAATVDLVHENEDGKVQPLQRPHQHAGLRLHTLDGGDHQDGAVEHAQHPFHLGDEIRVPGGVDQVDRDVVDGERHHGGLDRYAALPFQRERIGLGAAVIDAADLVDDTGVVEQPLGQGCLTGVYMRQDPQVQRSHSASCPLSRRKFLSGWT